MSAPTIKSASQLGICRWKRFSGALPAPSCGAGRHLSTWCRRSVRLMGAEPLKEGRAVMQYTDRQPRACMMKPVTMSSVTDP